MFRFLLLIPLFLPALWQSGLSAQSIILRATHYNLSPDGEPLPHFQAQVDVHPTSGYPYTLKQECEGSCVFENLPKGSTLVFSAIKVDDTLFAVSPFDIVLLNKHLQKTELLSHPALLIAADADCNGLLETNDIKIVIDLLNQTTPLDSSYCRPWTLLDASAVLPPDPFQAPLPSTITILNYNGGNREIEFLAIKTSNLLVQFPPPRPKEPASAILSVSVLPNPSRGAVWFKVQLPESGELTLEFYDLGGRLLSIQKRLAQSGDQFVELAEDELPGSGLYFWRVSAGGQQATGKLLRI